MPGLRTGFVSQTHTGAVSWEESLREAAAMRFDFVELYMDGATERTALSPSEVQSAAADHGLDMLVHLPFVDLDLGSPRDLVRDAAIEELRACLDAAAEMGAEKGVLHASTKATPPEWEEDITIPRILDAVNDLDAYARKRDVELCVENLPGILFTVHDFDVLFAETDASMTFDTGHARVDGMDELEMAAFLDEHADRVSHVHVNDARSAKDEHVPTGSGTLDINTALAPFVDDDEPGTLSIEVYTFDSDYLELSKRKLTSTLEL